MKIGIYGGTFDPPHLGHMEAARAAAARLELDRVLFIPASEPPHKELPPDAVSARDRLAMAALTADGLCLEAGQHELAQADGIELDRAGKSYTADTVEALRQRFPDDELWLLMGADMFLTLQSWREPERILAQAGVAAEYFRSHGITFDHAYSSTSERACDTLEILTPMPYTRVKGLKEWNFGVFESESEDLNPPLPYGDFFKGFGGEGEMEVRQRMSDTLTEIMERDGHESVLAVSHGGSSRQFMRCWEKNQKAELKGRVGNCCILKFEYENGEFSLIEAINHDFSGLTAGK